MLYSIVVVFFLLGGLHMKQMEILAYELFVQELINKNIIDSSNKDNLELIKNMIIIFKMDKNQCA